MNKKKWFVISLIIIVLVGFFSNIAFASSGLDDIISGMKGVGKVSNAGDSQVRYVLNAVIKVIQVAGSGIALIVVAILGIKYILASPDEKADYKKTAIPIVVGCILLFAGANIAGIIADFGNSFN